MQAKTMNLTAVNLHEHIERFEGPLYRVSFRMYYINDGKGRLCVGCCDKHLSAQSDRLMDDKRYKQIDYSEAVLYNNTKLKVKLAGCCIIANDALNLE